MASSTIILISLIGYMAFMLGVGFYYNKKGLDQSEFLLGGKKMKGWALALSERATCESAFLMLGATGYAYTVGISAMWLLIGPFIAISLVWMFLAKKFMSETNKYGILTLPGYFSAKFPRHANLIRWIATTSIGGFFLFYIAAQFSGAGKTLFQVFGWDITISIIVTAIIVIVYSSLGGFPSVVMTDVIQSILMVALLVILPIVGFFTANAKGLSITAELSKAGSGYLDWTAGLVGFALALMIFSESSWAFGYLGGSPQLSSRYMALKNEKDAKVGRNVAIVWMLLAFPGVIMIGLLGITLYGTNAVVDAEMILPFMVVDLMPPWIAGILLSGILAAVMSTADSQLLVITSSISEDIIHKSLRIKLDAKKLVTISRISMIVAGALGLILALMSKDLILVIVSWAWAGVGVTFSAAVLLAFFWKRYTGLGIIATILTGGITTIIWMSTSLEQIISARFMAFVFAALAGIIVSILFPEEKTVDTGKEKLAETSVTN